MRLRALRMGILLGISVFWQMAPLQAKEQLIERPLEDVSEVFAKSDADDAPIIKAGFLSNSFHSTCDSIGGCCSGLQFDSWKSCCTNITGCASNCCDHYGIVGTFGYNGFRGISDFVGQSNFGAVAGVNVGVPVQRLSDYGIGVQAGASYGIYDLRGRAFSTTENSATQEQFFVTLGAYRRAQEGQRIQAGLVYDWMANDNWGVFANEPFLGQWRGQIEYLLTDHDGVGLMAARRDRGDAQLIGVGVPGVTAHFNSISYVNAFWHHTFQSGADYYVYVGLPEGGRPAGNIPGGGSLGEYIVGSSFDVPVTETLGIYTNMTYMRPSSGPGAIGSTQETWNLGLGLAWYPGRNACKSTAAGNCNMPYLPLANNGNFLVDTGYTPAVGAMVPPPTP